MTSIGFLLFNFLIWEQWELYSNMIDEENRPYWSDGRNIFFMSFHRVGLGLSLSLMFLPGLLGKNRLMTQFLGASFWAPAARLSY
jgi:hypothetical protein